MTGFACKKDPQERAWAVHMTHLEAHRDHVPFTLCVVAYSEH